MILLVIFGGALRIRGVFSLFKVVFNYFSFCNPSHNCKYALNLNAKGVNLNVIIKDECLLIFIHIVRNFAFMSDFRKLRQFLLIFVALSFYHFEL